MKGFFPRQIGLLALPQGLPILCLAFAHDMKFRGLEVEAFEGDRTSFVLLLHKIIVRDCRLRELLKPRHFYHFALSLKDFRPWPVWWVKKDRTVGGLWGESKECVFIKPVENNQCVYAMVRHCSLSLKVFRILPALAMEFCPDPWGALKSLHTGHWFLAFSRRNLRSLGRVDNVLAIFRLKRNHMTHHALPRSIAVSY